MLGKIATRFRKLTPVRRRMLGVAVLLALSGTALAAETWVGNMAYMGEPPGDNPTPSAVTVPPGVTGITPCVLVEGTGTCQNQALGGTFASSSDIQALGQQVVDLQQQIAQDISWLGYYTARAVRNGATARSIQQLQSDEEVPASMPCGNNGCTAQSDVANDLAGSNGAFGKDNPISGRPMVEKMANQGLLAKREMDFVGSSWAVHNQYFCSQSEVQAGMCESNAGVSALPDADIEGTTLLATSGIDQIHHPNLNAEAREQLVQNLTNQIPVPALPAYAYKSAAGKLAIGAKLQYQAQQSLAQTALLQISALHAPVQGLGTSLNQTVKGLGMPQVPANISMFQYLNYMQMAQYGNPKWYINISSLSKTALLREMAVMQAQNNLLQFLSFRERTDQLALQASQYATESQQSYAKIAEQYTASVNGNTNPNGGS